MAGNKDTRKNPALLIKMRYALAQERLKSAQAEGTDGYIWRTMMDDLVRDTHEVLEDHYFTWDNPPIINDHGTRGHPGDDFNCRCHAEPFTKGEKPIEQPTEEAPHKPAGAK